MYLTAHHVISPSATQEGINAFLYLHQIPTWRVPPPGIPDQNPGRLIRQSITVAPPGNRVRSYLDVVAPDDANWTEIRQSFIQFVSQVQRERLPWTGVVGRCLFRFGLERSLTPQWQPELHRLYLAVQSIDHHPEARRQM
jgi:hypothetical protein